MHDSKSTKLGVKDVVGPTAKILLRWLQIIFAAICVLVLVYLLFFCPPETPDLQRYKFLVLFELFLVLLTILLNRAGRDQLSARLFILAAVVGPWWSALMDPTIAQGNLFPLVYTAIPILFSSIFMPVHITVVAGTIQLIGLAVFIYQADFGLSNAASSLFFFVVFMFGFSLIFNILNRDNRQMIQQQMEKLQKQVVRDPLTGLNNRRFLYEYLEKEISRLKRNKRKMAVIICDIDNYKEFNDACGHIAGDDILVNLSNLLQKNFRKSDVICRYGGDEFLILMSGSGIRKARERAEQLKMLMNNELIDGDCQSDGGVTISVGISVYPIHGKNGRDLIKAADRALYRAKDMGKNRVEIA